MSLVVPNISDLIVLQYIVNYIATDGGVPPVGGDRLLRLFSNNLTPGENTVEGDITEVASAGYSPITLTGTNWTISTDGGINSAIYSEQTFTFTTSATVYGYYVTTLNDDLLWIERFSISPYTYPSDGGQLVMTPKLNAD